MNKKFEYKTILIHGPQRGVFAEFPFESAKKFGTRKAIPVKATFDGKMYRMNLLPHGNGTHWLHLKQEIREAIGKTEGDLVHIIIEKDEVLPEVSIPEYLQWLLEDDPPMKKAFYNLTYRNKKIWIEFIEEPKSDDTKVQRINQLFNHLREKQ
ncbi:DUF1905 domain-containing protein [Mariniphaga sediminis]|uniref:DUF1905 domain-containing protein n=1 Tax=Mariniphaga sediminis TaxID=1628158 RepID=A0A399D3F3_9BACT|nr:YdeI/OmpD-associated family protein [Mariniphaga sediminis]RIH65758.1 DUF1905 domain-containing protein [Mariniphaga sediminis]